MRFQTANNYAGKSYMNTNEEMLQFLHKSAEMSVSATEKLIAKTQDSKLKSELITQLSGYRGFQREAADCLMSHGLKPQSESGKTKVMSNFGMAVNTMIDSSASHIAEMMINGNTMGIIKMQKHLNRNTSCPAKTRDLCGNMIEFEKKCIDRLGSYLR